MGIIVTVLAFFLGELTTQVTQKGVDWNAMTQSHCNVMNSIPFAVTYRETMSRLCFVCVKTNCEALFEKGYFSEIQNP